MILSTGVPISLFILNPHSLLILTFNSTATHTYIYILIIPYDFTIHRCIHIFDKGKLPLLCSEFLNLLYSEPFCLLLSHLTGLTLSYRVLKPDPTTCEYENQAGGSNEIELENSKESTDCHSCCYGNIHLWQPGSYTLMSDTSPNQNEFILESFLFFNADSE